MLAFSIVYLLQGGTKSGGWH